MSCLTTRRPLMGLFLLMLLAQLASCGVLPDRYGNRLARGVAVIGVTSAPDVLGVNRELSARELGEVLEENGRFSVLTQAALIRHLQQNTGGRGDATRRFNNMLKQHAALGQLNATDVQWLMAANLPVSKALILRVVRNDLQVMQPETVPVHSASGELVSDRYGLLRRTARVTGVEAMLIDLGSGIPVWSAAYEAAPVNESTLTRYIGSSFVGSVAAHVANTMVNGSDQAPDPVAPSMRRTMHSLLREVVRNLP